jgi:hypothetical protein
MSEVIRVPEKVSGVKDSVQMDCKGVYTVFHEKNMMQQIVSCRAHASWENGIVSISYTVEGKHQSIGIRLDELMSLLREASEARKKIEQPEVEP